MTEIVRQKKTAKLIAVLILLLLAAGILASAGRVYAEKEDGTVSFTIYHQDRDGKELADTQVFFGHPGDKPVVQSLDIDGYVPQAKQITMTLSSNEEDNVFTFVYQTRFQALVDGGRSLKKAKEDGKAKEAPEASSAEAETEPAEQDDELASQPETVSDIPEEETLDLDVATPLAAPGQAQMYNVNTMFNIIFAVICLQIVVLLAIWRHVKRKDAAQNKKNEA